MPTTRISPSVDSAPGVMAWRAAVTLTLAAVTVDPVSIDAEVVTDVVASAIIAVIWTAASPPPDALACDRDDVVAAIVSAAPALITAPGPSRAATVPPTSE